MTQSELTAALRRIIRKYLPAPAYAVFIFGSRAERTNREFSDVDLGILGPAPISDNIKWAIEEELEESDIPYLTDVVDFATVSEKFKKIAISATIPI